MLSKDLTPWSHLRDADYFSDDFPLSIRYVSHDEAIEWHDHDFYEIVFVANGNGIHKVASQKTRIKRNDVCIIPPGVYHRYDMPRHLSVANIIFSPVFLKGMSALQKAAAPLIGAMTASRTAKSGIMLHLDADNFRGVKAAVETMVREYAAVRTGCREALMAQFTMCLICLDRAYRVAVRSDVWKNGSRENARTSVIERVQNYIDAHLAEYISGTELAAMVSLNPSYVSRLFKAETGYAVTEYINEARIKKACEMLATTDAQVIDIALSVGYNSISYFNRTFKAHAGMTPKRYRRERR
ncbi:MAG: AraC family transcriptional regulator [Spirochaetota bacterium]